jgi:hypothetical protein
MPDPEDMSPEAEMRELAEILSGGFMRLRGSEANLANRASELEGQVGLIDDSAGGCSSRNVPD